ncbi:MAG TPA: hypothetical protein VFX97_19840 [Pyrinomonadaceae bacterium]|nr:hypothetical protein [Pyrinomonadaceae bacterium]
MRLRIILVTASLLICFASTSAQKRSAVPDSALLRASFLATFGNDFELVKDGITPRTNEQGGGMYWLAYVHARQPGYFTLQYSFKRDDKHYSHEEREIRIAVAPKGCRRGPPSSGVYPRFCMGDTIIVPVLVSGVSGHEFKLTKQAPAADEDWKTFAEKYPDFGDGNLNKTPVTNPSESLRYVGRRVHKMLHRKPGYTLQLFADFEAVKPGKFNLLVGSSVYRGPADQTPPGSIPIIVVDRSTPLTLIAGREEVRGYTMGHNGQEYVSSTSGNSYMTSLIILQPGDRVSFRYLSAIRSPQFERHGYTRPGAVDPAESTVPVISVHPFALETKYDFGGWLVDYLP